MTSYSSMLLLVVVLLAENGSWVSGWTMATSVSSSRSIGGSSTTGQVMMSNDHEEHDTAPFHKNKEPLSRRHVLQQTVAATTAATATGLWLPPSARAAASSSPTTTTLNDGSVFPLASFGLQIYNDDTAYQLTMLALEVGYRNFFASVLANNQKGFAKAIRDSKLPRNELYICGSVVSNRVQGYEAAYQATTTGWERNLQAFGVGGSITHLDQIMLDYPGPDASSIQGQWASFETMKEQGHVTSLSVSNFKANQLECLTKSKVKPVVNQLPYSVAYHPGQAVKENTDRNILVQAWAPLGGSLGGRFSKSIKATCATIGKKYNKSWAQVALRWIVQSGASFTTQSQSKEHFAEDLQVFDFVLSEEDMTTLSSLAA